MDFDTANEDITSHELWLYFRDVEISTCCFKSWRHHAQDVLYLKDEFTQEGKFPSLSIQPMATESRVSAKCVGILWINLK